MSKLLKCIIVDDEPPAIRLLEKYIAKVSFLQLEFTTTNSLDALSYLEKEQIDVVFLDIQMPHLTGLQLSKIIDLKTKVIFTTAYPQFALESYNVNATDYLLKPFDFERFYKAISKIEVKKSLKVHTNKQDFIFVKTDGKNNLNKINIKDIYFIESLKNYVAIYLKDKQIITYNSLKNIKENLPEYGFVQIHKSFLIAIHQIEKTTSSSVCMLNKELPIGNTYKSEFFSRIEQKRL